MSGGVVDIDAWAPGQVWTDGGAGDEIVEREGAEVLRIKVQNSGDRPVQVGSHFHFFEVNKALRFEREKAWGMRLARPAGTAHRFEPGMEYDIALIPFGGERVVYGFNGLCSGRLDDPAVKARGLARAKELGYIM